MKKHNRTASLKSKIEGLNILASSFLKGCEKYTYSTYFLGNFEPGVNEYGIYTLKNYKSRILSISILVLKWSI